MIAKNDIKQLLTNNILGFWCGRMVDMEHGGFYGRIDGDNELHPWFDKAIILNTRILWTFAAAYRKTGNVLYLEMADRAFHYIEEHFVDPEFGGVYWMVNYKGIPLIRKKQVYAQAFAIYAYSEYYRIRAEHQVKERLLDWFDLLEKYAYDPVSNGYLEAFDEQWGPLEDVRLSEKDLQAEKTMNTHLHVLEAYTNLYRVLPEEFVKKPLRNLVELMMDRFVAETHHFHMFFDRDWKLLSREISYGHDIEGSWLIHEAIGLLGDRSLLQRSSSLAVAMVDAALQGLDDDGGLMNEGSASGVTDTSKHWWPQAEALVGLVNAWQISGKEKYLQICDQIWKFIHEKLVDEAGEWHWQVNINGEVDRSEDKAGPWKCPYHNGRALLELLERLPN